MALPKLDMIGIVCKDVGASARFYRRLGLEFPEDPGGEPYIEVESCGLRVSLNDLQMVKGIDPDWQEPTGTRMGMAFLCASPSDVDAKFEEMVAAGSPGHRAPWDAFWGQRYAQVLDPDGNVVDLFAPLA